MKRLERLTALLSYLQARRHSRMEEMVARFGVSERTLYRDLHALEEAGTPIGQEPGQGYFILGRHFLPPLAFTLEEAKSFIFVEQLAQKYLDAETHQHFASALEKIRQKLRDEELADVEALESRVSSFVHPAYLPQHLPVIERACAQKQVLQLAYQDYEGRPSVRCIEPIGITFYSQSWHVIAFCQLRQAYRDFSLNRIQQLRPTGQHFEGPHLTLAEYVQKVEDD